MNHQLLFSMLAGGLFSAAFAVPPGSRTMYTLLLIVIGLMGMR